MENTTGNSIDRGGTVNTPNHRPEMPDNQILNLQNELKIERNERRCIERQLEAAEIMIEELKRANDHLTSCNERLWYSFEKLLES